MSGHSKWAQIKRQKHSTDQKRGNLFTKFANIIAIAAREGGGDPDTNIKLRFAIERARSANVPNDNIERAIRKGTGDGSSTKIEETMYEGFGPAGSAFLVEAITDNKNRTSADIRSIFTKYGGHLGSTGSVAWTFERKGVIRISKDALTNFTNREEFELALIDAGAADIQTEEEGLTIFTTPDALQAVKEHLQTLGVTFDSAELEYVAKEPLLIQDSHAARQLEALSMELEDHPDINNYYTNAAT